MYRVYGICPPSDFKPGPILPAARPCQAVLAAFVDLPEGEHQKLIDSVLAATVERRQPFGVHVRQVVVPVAFTRYAVSDVGH